MYGWNAVDISDGVETRLRTSCQWLNMNLECQSETIDVGSPYSRQIFRRKTSTSSAVYGLVGSATRCAI